MRVYSAVWKKNKPQVRFFVKKAYLFNFCNETNFFQKNVSTPGYILHVLVGIYIPVHGMVSIKSADQIPLLMWEKLSAVQ